MTINKVIPASITEIEQQIAKVSAALIQARANQYAIAEKSLLAAQNAAATAKTKVRELLSKAGTTVAAQQRLALANATLAEKELNLANAEDILSAIESDNRAAQLFTKNVKRVMAGKKLGKKIKFTKKEKAVLAAEKKATKKTIKAEKNIKKQQHIIANNINEAPVVATIPVVSAPAEHLIGLQVSQELNTPKAPLIDTETARSTTDSNVEVPLPTETATEDQSTSIETALKL